MKSNLIISNLSIYGIAHALVDAACAGIVFATLKGGQVDSEYFLSLVVLYNVLAFALQTPFGYIFDKLQKPVLSAVIGCVLTAIGAVLFKFPLIALTFAGIGNALFHVGG